MFHVTLKLDKLFDATYNTDDNTIAVSSQCRIRWHIHICMAKRKVTKQYRLIVEYVG